MIHRVRARLHHENVRAANIFKNLIARFAVRKLPVFGSADRHAKVMANGIRQRSVGASAEDLELVVGQIFPLAGHTPARRRGLASRGRLRASARAYFSLVRGGGFSGTTKTESFLECTKRFGALALGFGRFRTPPTRYPPARHLRLLA